MKPTTCLTALAAALLPCMASAVTVEVGLGVASFQDRGNMTWYQEGLPHKLQLNTPAAEIGLTGDLLTRTSWGIAWHANYVYMGRVRTDAVATPDDANYNRVTKSCEGSCIAHSNFTGRGYSHGLRLTLEPYYVYRGWRLGVEGGAYISRNHWSVTVYDWIPARGHEPQTIRVDDRSGWKATPVVGVSIGRGNFDLSLRHYFNDHKGATFPAIWRGTNAVVVRYRF